MSLPIINPSQQRSLVPLHTLQSSLYRQLYPHEIDFVFDSMQQQPSSPKEVPKSPPSPASSVKQDDNKDTNEPSSPKQPPSPTATTTTTTPTVVAEQTPSPGYQCQWVDCDKALPDPEALYNHLCNDHIGRKSTGNLCLTCKWKDCGTSCAKRDHITSHLRVHTPLKPHVCEICKKPFKRPQDLKKHEKIHTEEHHAQHKHSKAITVADPAYSSRVRGDPPQIQKSVPSRARIPSDKLQVPVARAKSVSVSEGSSGMLTPFAPPSSSTPCSYSSRSIDFGVLPTPSPDIAHSPIHYSHPHDLYSLPNHLPSWEVLRPDGSSATVTPGAAGSKRSYDYGVGEFFTDVKKRRVAPAYDPRKYTRPFRRSIVLLF
ncbi:hypothetical protein NLI96_g10598 [Meripilus lineatus]|uniref:C2H2-type domain-containing protein n=1 Tax=Meripilus lineatus TaxID=2056292 RepID=A0AAD5UYE9_9APHY|nr:hypothetical protein NLI96_g10598 [Physisporinus lineatus]